VNFRPPRNEEPDVNLTPLIDVVFLLLIFFMVSTTFTKQSEVTVNLPKATDQPVTVQEDMIEVSIDASGQFFINEQRLVNIKLSTLMRALKETAGDNASPQLIIKADAQTPHQSTITVMDAARRLGFSKIGFATTHLEEDR
jgi:biopolymer transport protein ExbD